jgi:pimeloyl-ACP methyl ester carboxylesterase
MTILTLSGWTQPSDALSRLIPDAVSFDYSDCASMESTFEGLSAYRDTATIVAWSMGGWLTLQAIAEGVLSPKSLLLIAPPFQFVNDAEFSDGMPPDIFTQFRNNYATDPERTSSRFHGLVAKGDRDARGIMAQLEHHQEVTNTDRWLPWLDMLAERTLHETQVTTPNITLLHGVNDAIVPINQSDHILERHAHLTREVWQDACHAPHLHDTPRFLAVVQAML